MEENERNGRSVENERKQEKMEEAKEDFNCERPLGELLRNGIFSPFVRNPPGVSN